MSDRKSSVVFISAAVFIAVFGLYLFTLPPTVAPYRDAGEMSSLAEMFGIAHPSGYPLYVIASKINSMLMFLGDRAYALAVFSALSAAAACWLLFLIILYLSEKICPRLKFSYRAALCVSGAVLFAASDKLWYSAQVQEMYSLSIFLIFAAMLLFAVFFYNKGNAAILYAGSLVFGLALANRPDAILISGFMFFLLAGFQKEMLAKYGIRFFYAGLFCAFGVLIYGYLIVRSGTGPYMNWNSPDTLGSFLSTVTRKTHGHTLDLLSVNYAQGEMFLVNMWIYIKQLSREFSFLGLPLGLLGFIFAYKRSRPVALGLAAAFAVSGPLFIFMANMPPNPHALAVLEAHFLLPNSVFGILVCLGIIGCADNIPENMSVVFVSLLCGLCVQNIYSARLRFQMRGNYFAYDYVKNLSRTVPDGSITVIKEDVQLFSMWYFNDVKKMKPESVFLARGLSGSRWYIDAMKKFKGVNSVSLNSSGEWRRLKELNASRRVFFTSDVDLPFDFDLPVRSRGLAREILPSGEEDFSGTLFYDIYFYRKPYRYESESDFFNADLIEDYAKSHSVYGAELLRAERHDEALKAYRNAAYMKAVYPEVYASIGYIYMMKQDDASSYKYYRKSMEKYDKLLDMAREYRTLPETVNGIKRDYATALVNLGVLEERNGNSNQAKRVYERAFSLDPGQLQAYYNLAVILWHEQNWEGVVRLLSVVAAADPGFLSSGHFLEQARIRLEQSRRAR